MPGAIAIGYRATNPIIRLPNAAAKQVAAVTAAIGIPASNRMDGFTKTMYAIVMNVVAPARISVRQFVPRESNSKYRSARSLMPGISMRFAHCDLLSTDHEPIISRIAALPASRRPGQNHSGNGQGVGRDRW